MKVEIPSWEGSILVVIQSVKSNAVVYAAKGIIQSLITDMRCHLSSKFFDYLIPHKYII